MAGVDLEGLLRALEASVGAGQAQVESLLSFLRERSALDEGYATGLRGAAKRLVWAWLKTHWQAPAPAPSAAPGRVPGP